MKKFVTTMLLAISIASGTAFAQAIEHVVILVQENRSPDNLFGGDAALMARGANLWNLSKPAPCVLKNGTSVPVLLQPFQLDACFDPAHGHTKAWLPQYHDGAMDGACTVKIDYHGSCSQDLPYPGYTYVDNSLGLVTPYYEMADHYGYANYMFQTNQGASFSAHQFLFSGTSAPNFYNDPSDPLRYWEWFAAENPTVYGTVGCAATPPDTAMEVDPEGNESPGYHNGFPCYNHNTLATLLEKQNISWKYYSPKVAYAFWTAPNAMSLICGAVVQGACTGSEWTSHVSIPTTTNNSPILTDIQNCELPAVSWVTSDGWWSDHPGLMGQDGGPSFVAAVVNAIGGVSYAAPHCNYWKNTVILITWDDWGGFFDHVSPSASAGGPGIGYPNGTGSSFVYGFRVPLLVISPYVKPGYISGPRANPDCSHGNAYCHDFGSILGFVEHTFNLPQGGIGDPAYPYADYFAPDGPAVCPTCKYPLEDFFTSQFHQFTPILGAKYPPECFQIPNVPGCFPGFDYSSPDEDDIHPQE